MTSKEALKQYKEIYVDKTLKTDFCPTQGWFLDILEQDLERLDKYKKAIKVLNGFVLLTKGRNLKTDEWNIPFIYSLAKSKLITQQEYELLEEVLSDD